MPLAIANHVFGLARRSADMTRDDTRVRHIAGEIERYIGLHPDAADSVEGIRRWWLPATIEEASVQCVERALEGLITAGVLTWRALPDGKILYAKRSQGNGQHRDLP